jgi:hypothetical protein
MLQRLSNWSILALVIAAPVACIAYVWRRVACAELAAGELREDVIVLPVTASVHQPYSRPW